MRKNEFEKPQLSEVEDLTLQLALANKKLKDEQQTRSEMLSNISHDLRAPITAIRSSIDYLGTFTADSMISYEEYASTLHIMDLRSQVLETLINDLFYLTSLDGREDAFHFEKVPLGAFLEDYFFSTEADNRFRDRALYLDVPEDLSVEVNIDVNRMTRVLDNLFTNALKYSTSGAEIRLNTSWKETDLICVSVSDTGIGIPQDSLDKIFDRSYTVSSARTPNTATGSGLGLSIVRSIIEHHGGTVWCESKKGQGSTFYFTLPCY